jgi:hypothetical protein
MGDEHRLPERLSAEDEECFKLLVKTGYGVRSDKDPAYNCIAFAAGDETKKWDPGMIPLPGYYWPPGAKRGDDPDSLKSAFQAIGYEICTNGDVEIGFEKIAIYVNNKGNWTHAARQEKSGKWVSKLGEAEDIWHRTQHCFGDSEYGTVVYYMKRPLAHEVTHEEEKTEELSVSENKETTPSQKPSPTHPA